MTNKKTLIFSTAAGNFTKVDNDFLRDERLSTLELGALCRIIAYPNDFEWHALILQKTLQLSRDTTKALVRRFEELGYLHRTPRHKAGKLKGWNWTWYVPARPDLAKKNTRVTENPSVCSDQKQEEIYFKLGSFDKILDINNFRRGRVTENPSVCAGDSVTENPSVCREISDSNQLLIKTGQLEMPLKMFPGSD